MPETARVPSAEELEELTELVRRDPGSPAFVDLGDAYLRLGRPRDAIDVGARGLKANPANLDGRMMVSRAFIALHQWKQAQAELLKVVKTDKTNGDGFRLLGEVLMRRADYERALPVLQHAQNLDPANPAVLSLLKLARNGQPLAAPSPIPTPRPPQRAARPSAPPPSPARRHKPSRPPPSLIDDAPTRVAGDPLAAEREILAAHHASERGDPTEQVAMRFDPTENELEPAPELDAATGQLTSPDLIGDRLPLSPIAPPPRPAPPRPPPRPAPPRPAPAEVPAPLARSKRPSAPPPQAAPKVRPRVLAAEKPKDAARESLRQSAAMGENYLNELLANGLLDVPNVRTPEEDLEAIRRRRRSKSNKGTFIVLFTLLFLGVGGGGAWYYYTKKARDEKVAAVQADASELIQSATYEDLRSAIDKMTESLEDDDTNVYSMAVLARASGMSALLYGTPVKTADIAYGTAVRGIEEGARGWRDLVIARACMVMATLPELEEPVDSLAEVRGQLDTFLAENEDDHWVRWLQGRAMLAAGDRSGALAAFKAAEAGGEGPVVAMIDRADMLLDDGDDKQAMALYDAALEKVPNHPLAVMGRALARTERSGDMTQTMDDLNVSLGKGLGPRLEYYKALAFAQSSYVLEDYVKFNKTLSETEGVKEPRYLVRVALARIQQGDLKQAVEIRAAITWYGEDPQVPPLVSVLDAEVLLAFGRPQKALDKLGKLEGIRAARARGRALFDLGKYDEAVDELSKALEIADQDLEAEIWYEAARLAAGKEATEAEKELTRLGRQAKTKLARHAHGVALIAAKNTREARKKLDMALDEVGEDAPNPVAYRTHVALASLDLAAKRFDDARKHIETALEQNSGFLPADEVLGQVLLAGGDAGGAIDSLQRVIENKDAGLEVELAYAQAIVSQQTVSDNDREAARAAVRRAKDKGASGEAFEELVLAVDETMAEEMGFEPPKKKDGR